jgi:hypothetical protein
MTNRLCPYAAMIFEIQAANYEIYLEAQNSERADYSSLLLISFSECVDEISGNIGVLEMILRIPVKVERGAKVGSIGTIAGTLKDREFLVRAGLRKAIVRIDNEFHVLEIDNLRELSQAECFLLGIK